MVKRVAKYFVTCQEFLIRYKMALQVENFAICIAIFLDFTYFFDQFKILAIPALSKTTFSMVLNASLACFFSDKCINTVKKSIKPP